MGPFASGAAYYAVLSDTPQRLEREGPLLLELLDRAPGTRVVDLACGTGLHAEFLARHGAEVAAFDLSAEMVAYASEHRAHAAVTYAVGDMRRVCGGPWDLALCLGNSLSLLPSLADVDATFAGVRQGLAPRGLFLLQIMNYAAPAMREPRHRVERKNVADVEIIAVKSLVPSGDRTLLSLAFFSRREGEIDDVSETAVLLNLSRGHILEAAERAGMRVVDVLGAYDRNPFTAETSPDLIFVLANEQP